jgi:hypothetical protein
VRAYRVLVTTTWLVLILTPLAFASGVAASRRRRHTLLRMVVGGTLALLAVSLGASYAFNGRESSIAFGQQPSYVANRDWIIITGQNGTRQLQLAVTRKGSLPEIWQALANAGAAPGPAGVAAT